MKHHTKDIYYTSQPDVIVEAWRKHCQILKGELLIEPSARSLEVLSEMEFIF